MKDFLTNLRNDIQEMIFDCKHGKDYRGFDSNCDIEATVENAIKFFLEVLWQRGVPPFKYQIHCLFYLLAKITNKYCLHLKAVSFVHIFAWLAIEFGSFEDCERGVLLIADQVFYNNAFNYLVRNSNSSYGEDHHENFDNEFLTELRQ